ncbi:MAG TPA: hypothetical protein VHY84_07275 [Bryobacteraceae bacterium]|jgi:hypothetical protein|nr:hypothetical protein [Bryobacteraceae bacterium]
MNYPVMAVAFFAVSTGAFGQHLIVTAEGRHGAVPPEVSRDEVSVEVNKKPVRVDKWIPLRGDQANLELYIVIDDGEDSDVSIQFGSLKAFINGQPGTTRIGLAYLRNGSANIVAPLTTDHAQLVKALRLPIGQPGIAASPYMGISDLVKKWAPADARREVLLITSGIDPWSPPDPQNPYLQKAIADAQRAGILVHSIYYAGAGHMGHSYWRINWGQNYLSELGDETGGEAYWQGVHSPVSFDPYLKDLTQRLQNQYLMTVISDDTKGGLEPVRVTTAVSGVSLVAASRIDIQTGH